MNKKITLLSVLSILSILILASCGTKDDNEKRINTEEVYVKEIQSEQTMLNGKNPTEATNDVVERKVDDIFQEKGYTQVSGYGIAPSELSNIDMARPDDSTAWFKTLKIRYPQLYNSEDYEKEKRINDLIYKEVIYYHNVLESRDYVEYSIDYKIMEANDKIVSVLFLGEVSDYHTSNRFAHAVTINIKNEKELELEDFLKIDESFVEDYLYTQFEIVENNFEDIAENTRFIELFIESFLKISHKNDFYVTGDEIGIIIPTHDSMGYILIQGNVSN